MTLKVAEPLLSWPEGVEYVMNNYRCWIQRSLTDRRTDLIANQSACIEKTLALADIYGCTMAAICLLNNKTLQQRALYIYTRQYFCIDRIQLHLHLHLHLQLYS